MYWGVGDGMQQQEALAQRAAGSILRVSGSWQQRALAIATSGCCVTIFSGTIIVRYVNSSEIAVVLHGVARL